jgi:hypothetical protein
MTLKLADEVSVTLRRDLKHAVKSYDMDRQLHFLSEGSRATDLYRS